MTPTELLFKIRDRNISNSELNESDKLLMKSFEKDGLVEMVWILTSKGVEKTEDLGYF